MYIRTLLCVFSRFFKLALLEFLSEAFATFNHFEQELLFDLVFVSEPLRGLVNFIDQKVVHFDGLDEFPRSRMGSN